MRTTALSLRRAPFALFCLGLFLLIVAAAALAPWISPQDPYDNAVVDFFDSNLPPGSPAGMGRLTYWLGTDALGRDLVSAILYGLRITLTVAATASVLALVIGETAGLVSAYTGGWVVTIIMRLVDILLGFPTILVALTIMALAGAGTGNLILALVVAQWPYYARTARSAALVETGQDYIEAARCPGHADRARSQLPGSTRADSWGRRRIRLRQVDDGLFAHRPAAARHRHQRGARQLRRPGSDGASASAAAPPARRPDRSDLPGPDGRLEPGPDHRRADGRSYPRPSPRQPKGRPCPLHRGSGPRRHPLARGTDVRLSARVFRRDAATRGDRDRLPERSGPDHRRRGDDGVDVTNQSQIIAEIQSLAAETGTAILWITHDLSLLSGFADHVMVMYGGQVIETAPAEQIFAAPRHPYTGARMEAVPVPGGTRLVNLPGVPPALDALPKGCAFSPRCPRVQPLCREQTPPVIDSARCHFPLESRCRRIWS